MANSAGWPRGRWARRLIAQKWTYVRRSGRCSGLVEICDRDRKWSGDVQRRLGDAGIGVVLTPERAPDANACEEHFVRSIKEECLDRLIPIGERHFRRAVAEYVEHY